MQLLGMMKCSISWRYCMRVLKMCLVLTVMLSAVTFVYFSHEYNLTEYAFIPRPLTSLTEHVKSFAVNMILEQNRSDGNTRLIPITGIGPKYKLVDIPSLNLIEKPSFLASKVHKILWYNQPSWVDINFGNLLLRDHCNYNNCVMSNVHGNISDKSAIVFSLTDRLSALPVNERLRDQVWIIFWMEPPRHLDSLQFDGRLGHRHKVWRNQINWTMSYRSDSDIFYPYGSLTSAGNVSIGKNFGKVFDKKNKFAAWIVSNCHTDSRREEYVNELMNYGIPVDIYGRCGNKGYRNLDELKQMLDADYKFYLSFENSLCQDYVTEKFFRYFNSDVVLVVRGGANYSNFFPPKTYIDTKGFNSSESLANYLKYVANDRNIYTEYLLEKDKYRAKEIFNETKGFCRLCEKLNHLEDNRKVIEDIVPLIHSYQCIFPTDLNMYHHLTGYVTSTNSILGAILLFCLIYCIVIIYRRIYRK